MTTIFAMCPIGDFLESIADVCLESKEMDGYSDEMIKRIDDTVRECSAEDIEDWRMMITPWSDSREWKWIDDEILHYPIYMQECSGNLCKKLKEFLPNSLGEVTAIYACAKLLMGKSVEEMQPHLGDGLNIYKDKIIITLCEFPGTQEPMHFCMHNVYKEVMRKRNLLEITINNMDPGVYFRSSL
jgi:hypothetical protein